MHTKEKQTERVLVLRKARQVLQMPAELGPVRCQPEDVGLLEGEVSILVVDGSIKWIGPDAALPGAVDGEALQGALQMDCRDLVLLPGLVDCHTHLVYGGDRAHEFHLRNRGASYQEIAARGGGILSTMAHTRQASEDDLVQAAMERLQRCLRMGVTTVEIKSGYGLDLENETKMLRAIRRVGQEHPITVVPTFLGAHTVPPEYRQGGRRAQYVDLIIEEMLPKVGQAQLARYCDVFIEEGAFTRQEAERILVAAARCGLRPRVHADQFSAGGGAELAARLGAASADHLEEISDEGISRMAQAGVVAVALPGLAVFLDLKRHPPVRKLLERGVRVALATDANPGSCNCENLLLMTTLGCSLLKMTAEEALAAVTVEGARSLQMEEGVGTLEAGNRADIACYRVPHYDHIPYRMGSLQAALVIKDGRVVMQDGNVRDTA